MKKQELLDTIKNFTDENEYKYKEGLIILTLARRQIIEDAYDRFIDDAVNDIPKFVKLTIENILIDVINNITTASEWNNIIANHSSYYYYFALQVRNVIPSEVRKCIPTANDLANDIDLLYEALKEKNKRKRTRKKKL